MRPTHEDPYMGPLPRAAGCDCHVCRPEPSYQPYDRETIDAVLRHGWQVVTVGSGRCDCCDDEGADPDGDDAPAFAYTVGLGHRAGHPELVMSGLDAGLMHRALNSLAERVLAGRTFAAGDVVEDVLGRVPVALAQASPSALDDVVIWSGWFHRRRPEALVVVWPSTSGVFAWQPGAPAVLDELQPVTWREPIPQVGALAPDPGWPFPVAPDARVLSCSHVVDEGGPVLWVARESDPSRGEDWSLHCGALGHEDDKVAVLHLAHLVRGAPSVRDLAVLPLDWEAERADVDSPWTTQAIVRGPDA